MPARIPVSSWERYVKLRRQGHLIMEASKLSGISYASARRYEDKHGPFTSVPGVRPYARASTQKHSADMAVNGQSVIDAPGPVPLDKLSKPAARALEDVAFFAERYFGAILLPFHVQIANEVVRLLETPYEEYLIENIAPGAGKSFFKRIVGCWLTCRDRTFRGLMGSATRELAVKDVNAMRTALERPTPALNSLAAIRAGIAVNAKATLAADYGRFMPDSDDKNIWRADGFMVAQHRGIAVSDKELTWLAVGFDTRYIGTRVNGAFWDDPHDRAKMRTLEGREKMTEMWSDVAESRLETGGLLWLIQQRLGPGDLTSYALEQRTTADEDDDEESGEDRPVYRQIAFKAHYEEQCKGDHGLDAKPWPEGCLLFPRKLHWRKISAQMRKPNYRVVYQQEEVDPAEALVKMLWVTGGRDPETGEEHIGCWDQGRRLCEIPRGLKAPFWSIATVDPSPTRFWALQWWLYHPESQLRILLDLERRVLSADELIDRDFNTGEFTGMMPDWQRRSVAAGAPIKYWIYERNAAQRFALKYNHVQDWQRRSGVSIISHDTYGANKNAPEEAFGVACLGPHWRYGRVRLPGHRDSRHIVMKLVQEVLTYPHGTYDDQVMAQWFLEWNLPKLTVQSVKKAVHKRPSWAIQHQRTRVSA